MHSTIILRPEDLRLVQAILRAYVPGREVRAFGSRVIGTVKPASDLDLCVMGDDRLPPATIERLRSAFSESALPMRVDVVAWADLKPGFRRIIRNTGTGLKAAG